MPDLATPAGWLPVVFLLLMGVAMLAYVVLDGYDGKTRTQVKVAVEEREQVQTAGGSREAFRVAFLPYKNGVPSDALQIRVWYTADASHVPVLVTAKPVFGDVKMTLRDSRNAKL